MELTQSTRARDARATVQYGRSLLYSSVAYTPHLPVNKSKFCVSPSVGARANATSDMPTVIVRDLPVETASDDNGTAEAVVASPDGIDGSMPDLRVATSRKPSRRPLTSPRTYQCMVTTAILSLLISVASAGAVVASQASRGDLGHEFRLVRLSNTKCLDGSPAAYYIAENASSSSWVVWLEGGGICRTQEDCEQRSRGPLGSSTKYPASRPSPREMLSSDPRLNPDLHSWNRVFIPYCSGDTWVGTEPQAVNPFSHADGSWRGYFQGHSIIEDVYQDITRLAGATEVSHAVLTGCSAGGIGTIYNCDFFARLFPNGTNVACRPEAGWFMVPIARYPYFDSPAGPSSDPDPRKLIGNNWTAHIQPFPLQSEGVKQCMADVHSGRRRFSNCDGQLLGPAWCCVSAAMVYAYSETRMFVSQNTADAFQVFVTGQCPAQQATCAASVRNQRATAYWDYVRSKISESLTELVLTGSKRGQDGMFAAACLQHCFPHWLGPLRIDGKTDAEAFGDWFFRREGTHHMRLDNTSTPRSLCECANGAGYSSQTSLEQWAGH